MRRRRAALALALALGVFAACTFPDVGFAPAEAPLGSEAGADGTAAGKDGSSPPPPALPSDVDPDGGSVDATVVPEGGGRIDAGPDGGGCAAGGGSACDCDDDTSKNSSPGCNAPDGGADCDDFSKYIHPGVDFVQSPWDTASPWPFAGDWNCDRTVTKQYAYDVTCGSTSNCTQGFDGHPACGQSGKYNICKYNPGIAGVLLPSCKVDSSETRVQGCK